MEYLVARFITFNVWPIIKNTCYSHKTEQFGQSCIVEFVFKWTLCYKPRRAAQPSSWPQLQQENTVFWNCKFHCEMNKTKTVLYFMCLYKGWKLLVELNLSPETIYRVVRQWWKPPKAPKICCGGFQQVSGQIEKITLEDLAVYVAQR